MPQGRDHIYFLMDSGNKSYYVSNGLVLSSATPRPLQHTPDGWRNIVINNERNQKYFAVDRSFSASLDFVKDGAQILKHLYYNRGIEEKVFLCIAKQVLYFDDTHYGYYYTLLYKGELDFANFKHDGPKVTCNIMEGGMVKYLKNRENTTYEIPIDDAAINVKMDGVRLLQAAKFIVLDNTSNTFNGNHSVPLTLVSNESLDINIKSVERIQLGGDSGSAQNEKLVEEQAWFYRATTNIPIKLKWNFKMRAELAPGIPPNPSVQLFLVVRNLRDDGSVVGGTTLNQFNTPINVYRENTFQGEATITGVEPGTSLYLFMGINIIGESGDRGVLFFYNNQEPFEFEITEAIFRNRTSYIKAIRPLKLFQEIIQRMTEGQYTAESDTLTENEEIVITSGDAIRGIEGAKIKTSLLQFFQSFNTVLGIGMGMVGSQLRLEKKSYWVDYTDPIDLGEVKNLTVSPATDYIYSALKIGYAEQEYENVNGRQEFNNTHEYLLPVTKITKTLELISPYRADCYGIEFTRINLEGKTTTDDKSDNDVFLLHIKKTPIEENGMTVYELDRSLNAGATGLLENETVFNIYLSPKHCLFRNGPYLRSLFYKQDGRFIKFQTTEKNAALVSDVTENADVMVASLGDGLFAPNLLEADVKMPRNVQAILDQNPLKAFTFTWLGMRFTGIPVKESTRESDRAAQTIQLLMAPDQDLTMLETVNG